MSNAIDNEISNIIERGRVIKVDPVIQVLNIARLKELYEEKNKGKMRKEMIPVNKQIAEDLNISEKQVIRLCFFRKLIPELKTAFLKGEITLSNGIKYAELSDMGQRIIMLMLESGCKLNQDIVEKLQSILDSNTDKKNYKKSKLCEKNAQNKL